MSPWSSAKSSETPLASSSTRNGPYGTASGRPSSSVKNAAVSALSRTDTIVWFSSTAIPRVFPTRQRSEQVGHLAQRVDHFAVPPGMLLVHRSARFGGDVQMNRAHAERTGAGQLVAAAVADVDALGGLDTQLGAA